MSAEIIQSDGATGLQAIVSDEDNGAQRVLKVFDMSGNAGGCGGSFDPTVITGYNASQKQHLVNDNGTLKWEAVS